MASNQPGRYGKATIYEHYFCLELSQKYVATSEN